MEPGQYVAQLIRDNLPAAERAAASRSPFARWDAEDATDDPAEIHVSDADACRAWLASVVAAGATVVLPTADAAALDCDVILVALLRTASLPNEPTVIATSNVGHLARFMPADAWQNIRP